MSPLISPKKLSSGLLEGPMYHASGSVKRGDYDGSLLTRVYLYSGAACIMHVALTKQPAPDSTGVLSGVWFGLSSWVGCYIKFLEAPLPLVYTYSEPASVHTVKHLHAIMQCISHRIKPQMLCSEILIWDWCLFLWKGKWQRLLIVHNSSVVITLIEGIYSFTNVL